MWSKQREIGAGNEIRTRDPDLGKVVLYQLSYSRLRVDKRMQFFPYLQEFSKKNFKLFLFFRIKKEAFEIALIDQVIQNPVSDIGYEE